ncbi:MAG: hypothetical protein R3253_03115 [Longimicrobiales bacterium]|nr:hypothetical protein [Longimicrobiales bacterium]
MTVVDDQVRTIRHSVGLSRLDHLVCLRVSGDGAWELMNRVFPREVYVRDGQLVQGLILEDSGVVAADCQLGNDEGEYMLLCEGLAADSLADRLASSSADLDDVEITDEGRSRGAIGIDGPYAWELMSRMVGPEVVGLPYLTFFHFDGVTCCRTGKTGEYGYVLLVERDEVDACWSRLAELGEGLDLREVGLEALEQCALENWFFNIRREGSFELTPLELQLQWRVSRRKSYVGSAALEERRRKGILRRLTCIVGEGPLDVGDPVHGDGGERGIVLNAGHSHIRGDWVALALLDLDYALPGVDMLTVGEGVSARTVTPPVITNRSLYVNPQVHSYASRDTDDFPPLVRG